MFSNNTTHYAAKKRRRPQTKKDKDSAKPETKSNPSKRHRDRLNLELDNLAKLIPFSEEVINKLDKLSILRLAVSYLKNKSYHTCINNDLLQKSQMRDNQLEYKNPSDNSINNMDAKLSLQAMNGFIVVVSQSHNIFYVSESIQNLLGFPQCDVINSSMLDLIHADDRHIFTKNMKVDQTSTTIEGETSKPEYSVLGIPVEVFRELSKRGMMHRSFVCRLRCLTDNSSGFLALHFTGHIRLLPGQKQKTDSKDPYQPELALFLLATVIETPSILEIRTKNFIFRTKHKLDYTPLGIDAKGRVVLGYTEHQLRQRSGYEFIHSADMMHCADAHTKLMKRGESGMTVFRILHKENKWLWVTASAKLVCRHGRPEYIVSTHRPIPDQEGMEHMQKRNEQFRFNFTGQAVLYGEVNPTGAKPTRPKAGPQPVEQSNSSSSSPQIEPQQQQPQQQQRNNEAENKQLPTNDNAYVKQQQQQQSSNYENPSLFDAQTMQSDEIYTEEAQKATIFDDIYHSVTTGIMPVDPGNMDLMTLESNDFGTCYYNIGPHYDTVFNDPEIDAILPPSLDSNAFAMKAQEVGHNNNGCGKWAPEFPQEERIFPMCSAAPIAAKHYPEPQLPVSHPVIGVEARFEPHPHQFPNPPPRIPVQNQQQQQSDQGYSSPPEVYMQISPETASVSSHRSSSGSIKRPYPYGRCDSSASSAKMAPSEHAVMHDRPQQQQQQPCWPQEVNNSHPYNSTKHQPRQKSHSQFPAQRKQLHGSQQPPQQQQQQQQQMYRESWYTEQQVSNSITPHKASRHKTTRAHHVTNPPSMQTNQQAFNQMRQQNQGGSSNFQSLNMQSSSHIVMTQVEQTSNRGSTDGDFPNYSPPDAAWNDLELVDYQQSSTKFDLQEIAVRFQTSDPMSKAHDYMRGEDNCSLYSGLKKGTLLMNQDKLKNMNAQYTTQISKAPAMNSRSMIDSDSSPATMNISPCESMANGESLDTDLLNGLPPPNHHHHLHSNQIGYTTQMNDGCPVEGFPLFDTNQGADSNQMVKGMNVRPEDRPGRSFTHR